MKRKKRKPDLAGFKGPDPDTGMEQMQKLRKLLDQHGIEWTDDSDPQLGVMRTRIPGGFLEYSVIFGPWSAGNAFGLLELWDFVHGVIGFLAAEAAFRIIDIGLRGYKKGE